MITVDGEAVNPPGADDRGGEGGDAKALRGAWLELKLCMALVSLKPPYDLSVVLHARTAEALRTLRRYGDVILPADLSDEQLKEAAGIVRAFRALPSFGVKGFQRGSSFRAALGEYALDLAAELDSRAARDS